MLMLFCKLLLFYTTSFQLTAKIPMYVNALLQAFAFLQLQEDYFMEEMVIC